MTTVLEIETAVKSLSHTDFNIFSNWFSEVEADHWDKEIERDVDAGMLDSMGAEALEDFSNGRARKL